MANVERAEDTSAYLSSLSGDAAERITAMKWARYLGAAFGPSGALSALRYYAEIGWIGDDVRRTMVDYVRGLTIEELELEKLEPDLHGSLETLEGTEFERHARSLQFVAAISGRSIEHGLASLQLAETVGQRGLTGISGVGAGAAGQPPSMGPRGGPFGGNVGVEPGEQAQRAAHQRDADRQRRDERAGAAPASESDPAPDADSEPNPGPDIGDEPETEQPDDRPTDDAGERTARSTRDETRADGATAARADDVEVSMADVTPGSSGDFDVGTAADETDRADETDADLAVGDETVPSSDPSSGAAVDVATSTDPAAPDPDPSPAPSPSESAALDDLDATFEDGAVDADGAAEEPTESETAGDPTAPPDENRCIALTRDGDRCSLPASDGEYCHQHTPDED